LGSGMNGVVNAVAEIDGLLIAGGFFTTAGGTSVGNNAAWDGQTWQPLGPLGLVRALTIFNGELIAGVDICSTSSCVRRWDGMTWQNLGSFPTPVLSMAVYSGELYIAQGGGHVLRWNGSSWQLLPQMPGFTVEVHSMREFNGELIASGGYLLEPSNG